MFVLTQSNIYLKRFSPASERLEIVHEKRILQGNIVQIEFFDDKSKFLVLSANPNFLNIYKINIQENAYEVKKEIYFDLEKKIQIMGEKGKIRHENAFSSSICREYISICLLAKDNDTQFLSRILLYKTSDNYSNFIQIATLDLLTRGIGMLYSFKILDLLKKMNVIVIFGIENKKSKSVVHFFGYNNESFMEMKVLEFEIGVEKIQRFVEFNNNWMCFVGSNGDIFRIKVKL